MYSLYKVSTSSRYTEVFEADNPTCRSCPSGVLDWKARISIKSLPGNEAVDEQSGPAGESVEQLAPLLCYACHSMLISRSSKSVAPKVDQVVPVPIWVSSSLAGDTNLERMKDFISEFLLVDE